MKCSLAFVLIIGGLIVLAIGVYLFWRFAFNYPEPPPASQGDIFLLLIVGCIIIGIVAIVIGILWLRYCKFIDVNSPI